MSTGTVHLLKANFNGGEMTPLLDARVDTEKHATGCRLLENMIPRPYGGVMKRPGTQYCDEVLDSSKATRLIPFNRSSEVKLALEFGEFYIRFWYSTFQGGLDFASKLTGQFVTYPATAWNNSTSYAVGNVRIHGGKAYICIQAHSSGSVSDDEPGVGSAWVNYWNLYYIQVGECVNESGIRYYCTTRYNPSGTFASDSANWYGMGTTGVLIIPTDYEEEELFQIQFIQLNDVMFLAHPNHFPKRLTRLAEKHWVLEDVPFEFAPVLDVNETTTALQVQWNESDVDDWSNAVTSYAKGDRVLSITQGAGSQPPVGSLFTCHTGHNAATTSNDEPGNGSNWGSYWNLGTSSTVIEAWAGAVTYAVGRKVRYQNVIYECISTHTSSAAYPPGYGAYWARTWKISSADGDLAGLTLQMAATEGLFTANDVGSIWQLSLGTTARATAQALPAASSSATVVAPTAPLFIQGAFLVRTNWVNGEAPTGGSLVLEESFDNTTWSRLREWALDEAKDPNINSSFEAPATGAWYRVSATYNNNTAADKVFIEPESSVLILPFKITGYTSSKLVTGKFLMPNDQLPPSQVVGVSTTVYRRPAFIAAQGFPRAVTFHDSRLWWGGTEKQPARLWGSAPDDFYIYLTGPNDTDGIDLTLASSQANAIQWVASQNRQMVIGTTAEEWTLDSGDTDDVLTPSKIRARRRTRYGSEAIAPVMISDALLWVQRGGKKVREFAYRFETDSYTAPEMTLLAEHLFRSAKIVQMAFQATPDPTIWAVDDRGVLHGFSYDREQQITAWHRHRTGEREESGQTLFDAFESVATIYGENGADEVWFIVRRQIAGATKRFVERFKPLTASPALLDVLADSGVGTDSCFTDCSIIGTNHPLGSTTTFFSHLAGRALRGAGAASGGVVPVRTATAQAEGVTTFSGPLPQFVLAGLPIHSRLRPLKVEIPLRNGSSFDRRWRLTRVKLNLLAACGGKVSASYPEEGLAIDYQGQSQPYTGQFAYAQEMAGDPGDALDFYLTHSDPTPFHLLSATLQVEASTE